MTVIFYRDVMDKWRWKVLSRNGKVVADSADGYVRKSDCTRWARQIINPKKVRAWKIQEGALTR